MPRALCALAMTGVLQGVSARLGGGVEPRPYGGQQGVRKKNPPVTASPRQPPLGKGALRTGGTDCHSQCAHWLRNDSFIFHGGGIEDGFCGGCRGRGNGEETFGLIGGEGREVF